MSIHDLMKAVREGNFEKSFKNCNSTEDKVKLFNSYGISISLEQYRDIEKQVSAIKNGENSAYNIFKKGKISNGMATEVSEFELSGVSAGRKLNADEKAVYESLTSIPDLMVKNNSEEKSDDDVKHWEIKSFLTGRGLF